MENDPDVGEAQLQTPTLQSGRPSLKSKKLSFAETTIVFENFADYEDSIDLSVSGNDEAVDSNNGESQFDRTDQTGSQSLVVSNK